MAAPSLMYENGISPLKGWMDTASLDFAAKLSANVTFVVPRGRCLSLNASSEWETGAGNQNMPVFMLNGSEDFDVSNPGTTPSGNFMHQAIAPTGVMSGLVATGGYELETTEFVNNLTYLPNQPLQAIVANTTLGNATTNAGGGGVLTNASTTVYTDAVCGIVSRATYTNEHGLTVLGFWPVYLPIA